VSEIDLTSPEVKQAIADAVAAEVQGLKAKNAELIEANKKLRKGQEVDPEEYSRLEQANEDLKGKLAEASKALGKSTKDLEAANKRASDIDAAYNRSLVDSALSDALTKAGVTNPVHIKAAKAMHAAQLQVAVDGDNRVIKAGDKALADFITEWAASDEGKFFVAAPASHGDGARGGHRGNANTKSVTRAELDKMSPTDASAHFQAGGTVVDG
jgi:hypothetical protein